MIRGFYTAVAGMLAAITRNDVVADNLANTSTTAFKASRTSQADFKMELARSLDGAPIGPLGTGVYVTPPRIDQSQGPLQTTGVPSDFAIGGDGLFVVQNPANGTLALTRDGSFHVTTSGQLVTADGWQVLDDRGQPILVNNLLTSNVVDTSGVIRPTGQRFALVAWPASGMVRLSANRYDYEGTTPLARASGTVIQGTLEQSNTDIGLSMTELITNQRSLSLSSRVFSINDETIDAATSVARMR